MLLPIAIIIVSLIIMTFFIVWGVKRHRKDIDSSQVNLSDRELLLLINTEPDNIINDVNLAKKSGMSLRQASTRLQRLAYAGVANQITSGLKYFYELKSPIVNDDLIDLSEKPFISIDDLFTLFEHFGYKMTMQDICIATGLPFKVIKKEMKYFQKEGVVHEMSQYSGTGMISKKFYTLQEGYKGGRKEFAARDQEMNLELERIYNKASRDEDGFV